MTDLAVDHFAGMIRWTHDTFLEMTQDLSDGQFARQASSTSPPIGWHVFHIGRWADRLQASLPMDTQPHERNSRPRQEIWAMDELAMRWEMLPERLGWLETGSGMDIDSAVLLASVGKSTILDYAQQAFEQANQAVSSLKPQQLQQTQLSILPHFQVTSTGQLQIDYAGDRPVPILDDLLFHISHASRHLGMIEALRGVLFTINGTATV